jgi:hypothetical protein
MHDAIVRDAIDSHDLCTVAFSRELAERLGVGDDFRNDAERGTTLCGSCVTVRSNVA